MKPALAGLGFDTGVDHSYGANDSWHEPSPVETYRRSPLLGADSPALAANTSPRVGSSARNSFEIANDQDARLERRGSWQNFMQRNPSTSSQSSLGIASSSSSRMTRSGSTGSKPLTIDTTSTSAFRRPPSPTSRQQPATSSFAHHRQISLTSACLPATATYTPDRGGKYEADDFATSLSSAVMRGSPSLRNTPDFSTTTPTSSRADSDREDNGGKAKSKSSPKKSWRLVRALSAARDEKTTEASAMPDMAKSSRRPSTQTHRILYIIPHSLAAPLLGPFASYLLGSAPTSARDAPQKKQSLTIRLFSMLYICFSLLFLTSHILGYDAGASTRLQAENAMRLIPRTSRDGQPAQFAISGWAEGFAKGLREKMPLRAGSKWALGNEDDVAQRPEPSKVADELSGVQDVSPIPEAKETFNFDDVSRKWSKNTLNPLTTMSHPYRFSKMHSKMTSHLHDEIEPFAFRAQNLDSSKGDVTACLYTNEAWLDLLPDFASRWNGPISLVYETLHARSTVERVQALQAIEMLRKHNPTVRDTVDFHIVSTIPATQLAANRTRERMLLNPIASNYQLNVARFFAPTEMVWLVGDARILPSTGLRRKLAVPSVRKLTMSMGDALVIPTFANLRVINGEGTPIPSLESLRAGMNLNQAPAGGVSESEFASLGKAYVAAHSSTLQISMDSWPKRKSVLVGLSSAKPPASVMPEGVSPPPGPAFAMLDQSWDPNRGPSNWALWRRGSVDPRLSELPENGGGAGLGINGGVGGGHVVYKVAEYELHYAPSVVVSKDAQPWCTERFLFNKAACIYQMYLTGAEMWILPDEWAFTVQSVDGTSKSTAHEADRLRDSISSRLYTKFHAEACMHYGREFLSMSLWEHARVAHLRTICARVLSLYDLSAKSTKLSQSQ